MIMKRFAILLSVILLCTDAAASVFAKHPTKRDIMLENRSLKISLDSLNRMVDSLQKVVGEPAEEVVAVESPEEAVDTVAFDPELSDSLFDVWMKSRQIRYYSEADLNMDGTPLQSKVSDTVMMQRLEAINPFFNLPFNETVRNYMVLYAEKMPVQVGRLLGLSSYYMPILEEKFAKYDLPLELKYLAVIESHLNPVARSRVGAMGMWQFMYTTARSYGLKINSFMDERLDVEKAADAAARYLKDAYMVFGDWNLAICSYNCGPGNVQKAIRRSGSRKFWDIYDFLPRETRGYVPAMVGAMYAMTYYREYGIVPQDVGMPAAIDTFEVRRNLHFKQVNEVVGVPMEVIKEFNPQYTHDIIPGNEGVCVLKLPYKWTPVFLAAEPDSLYGHKADTLLSPQVLKNIRENGSGNRIAYKVKNGDYLGRIAGRYHVSVNQIMKWNHLRNSKLRVGQVLYIYKR